MWLLQFIGYRGRKCVFRIGQTGPIKRPNTLEDSAFFARDRRSLPTQILEFWVQCGVLRIDRGPAINWLRLSGKSSPRFERLGLFSRAMAESKLLAPELSDAESMGDETVRFQELLLQVRPDWTFWESGCLSSHTLALRYAASVPRMPCGSKEAYGNRSCLAQSLLDFKRNGVGVILGALYKEKGA